MVCHHGAGYSGLSFACFAKEVTDLTNGNCGVLALDARQHGKAAYQPALLWEVKFVCREDNIVGAK